MGCDLELTASRSITVNMIGIIENQSYDLPVISFTREICELIVESDNSYEEYCKQVRKDSILEPIYIWDDERFCNMPEIIEREEQCILYGPKPEDIVGYKSSSEDHIEWLDECIKQALDNHYQLRWWISY